nr:hypothetical protein [Tanacetum cinerariifolium]
MEVDVRIDVEDEVESSNRGNMEVGVDVTAGIDIPDGMLIPDTVECLEHVKEGLQDIYDHVIEITLQRIEDIETGQKEFKARSLIAGGGSYHLLDHLVRDMGPLLLSIDVEDEVESSNRGNMEVGVDVAAGIDIPDGMLIPDTVECLEHVKEGLQDIYDHVIEIPLQRIEDIETGQKEFKTRSLIAGGGS